MRDKEVKLLLNLKVEVLKSETLTHDDDEKDEGTEEHTFFHQHVVMEWDAAVLPLSHMMC
jgi:hypothetical protein